MPTPKKDDPSLFCKACSSPLKRKRLNGRLGDRGAFLKRKFCDLKCMGKAKERANATRGAFSKRARRFLKRSCEQCGTPERLAVHHKDRNWRNNAPANLMTLCASCHTLLHHAAGDINPSRLPPPCRVCGEPSARRDLCGRHLQRFKKYGDPRLTKRLLGGLWTLVSEPDGATGSGS